MLTLAQISQSLPSFSGTWTTIWVSALVASVVSGATAFIALTRFKSERRWEKKVGAYEGAIRSLHSVKRHLEADLLAAEAMDSQEFDRLQSRDTLLKGLDDYGKVYSDLLYSADTGSLYLTDEAMMALRGAADSLTKPDKYVQLKDHLGRVVLEEAPYHLVLGDQVLALEKSLERLVRAARTDVFNDRWFRSVIDPPSP